MNLSVNNVNFTGKKEMMYGLKRAAIEARSAEINRSYSFGPHSLPKTSDVYANMSAARAYSDMVIRDDEFVKTAKEFTKDKNYMYSMKEILKPIKLTFCEINPFEKFQKQFLNAALETEDSAILKESTELLSEIFKQL